VLEPRPREGNASLEVLRRHELRYEDGPHDAEALLVHPIDSRLFVVTKERTGVAGVYRADAGVLRRVGEVRLDLLVRRPGAYARAVTAGEIRGDGRKVVLRTPFEAFEWTIDNEVHAAFAGEPLRIPLPFAEQGEAIAYTSDGASLLATSEGEGSAVHLLPGTGPARPNYLAVEADEPPPSDGDGFRLSKPVALVIAWVLSFLAVQFLPSRRRRRRRTPRRRRRSA
jgi:hypothetical protein